MTARTKPHPVLVAKRRPRPYPLTPQQETFRQAAEFCGIRQGITRAELVDSMRNCIPEFYRNRKAGAKPAS